VTAAEILASLTARSVRLSTVNDRLRVEAPAGVLSEADRLTIARHKSGLMTLLGRAVQPHQAGGGSAKTHVATMRAPAGSRQNAAECAPVGAPWDASEAAHWLGVLRAEIRRVEVQLFAGKPPAALAMLLADAVVIGERYIRDHELEAARGWDALALLRDLVPHVRDVAARWTPTNTRA
jgi:hypothetical protein